MYDHIFETGMAQAAVKVKEPYFDYTYAAIAGVHKSW